MTKTSTLPAHAPPTAATIEQVLVHGDLAKLNPEQRVAYYRSVCESLGLNPLTKPFAYIALNGKLQLYALRDATDQLRRTQRISIDIVERQMLDDLYVVRARATSADGRTDESIGAVALGSLRGEARANGLMKAETKAKRRVTLSICGLGWLDETEAATIPSARPIKDGLIKTESQLAALAAAPSTTAEDGTLVNTETGEVLDTILPPPESIEPAHAAPPPILRVLSVDDSKVGKNARGPWTLYRIAFSDGKTLKTFSKTDGNLAIAAATANAPVVIETDGDTLTSIRLVPVSDEGEPQPFLTKEDLPF